MTRVLGAALAAALIALATPLDARQHTWQVAFFNIQSGKGVPPLRGRAPAPFADNHNCTDRSMPMNAWPLVQAELRAALAGERVLALGLAEAWRCGSPARVREALGWKADTGERNGTALLARYGFAAEPRWTQLDTSRNVNPADTMWVVGAPVCVDRRCSRAIPVYVTHWFGTGRQASRVYRQQSEATVRFMSSEQAPHVLMGDLNVFEGQTVVCRQLPNNTALQPLRQAGYVDAWQALHGAGGGFTGMLNREGCGAPEGAPWKRIDYVWLRGLRPVAMSLFATGTPGEAALSDHAGILATFSSSSS